MALVRKLPVVSDRPAAKAGLRSERTLWPERGPGVFEQELDSIEDALGLQARLRQRTVAHDRQLLSHCQLSAPFRQT